MSKLPYFPFYTGDWLKDLNLRARTLEERGAWIDLLAVMHESEERGVLIQNGKPMDNADIARVLGISKRKCDRIVSVLVEKGVASRRETDGALYSRRSVRDEEIRRKRADGGKQGGRPPRK